MKDGFDTQPVKPIAAPAGVVYLRGGAAASGPGRSRRRQVIGGVRAKGEGLGASAGPIAAGGVHVPGTTA